MDMQKNIGQEIEKAAYELWEKGGCLPGREIENWLEAERIVKSSSFEKMPVELKKAVPRTIKKETAEKKAPVKKTTKKTGSTEVRKGK